MAPARKGDGTGLVVNGFQEVRKGDGTVLWSPSTAIPNSVTDHWPMDEGSGTTAANNEGSVDISLVGAGWTSETNFNGYSTTYDGTDDVWETANTTDLNGSEYGIAVWFKYASHSEWENIITTGNQNGGVDSGYRIEFRGANEWLRFAHRDGSGSANVITTTENSLSLQTGQWYFIALSGSGDNGSLYIWDTSQELFDGSGSGSRTTSTEKIMGMGAPSASTYIEGNVGEAYASSTTEVSKSDWQTIWEDTRPQ